MPEPLSLIAIGAAIGGAAGKFVEKAWDSGEKWITTYFQNHRARARETAEANSAQFLHKLGVRLEHLEQAGQLASVEIEMSLERPEFSVVLQRALLAASQSDSETKHRILSDLVAAHLQAKPESLLALVSKIACDTVSEITPNQLKLLGLISTLRHLKPGTVLDSQETCKWFEMVLNPYLSCSLTTLDLIHLQALSCIQQMPWAYDLWTVFNEKVTRGIDPSFRNTDAYNHVAKLWPKLQTMQLTSVGQLLGLQVIHLETGLEVPLNDWDS